LKQHSNISLQRCLIPDGHLKFPHLWPPKFLQG
jgi:hypothetical protein